MGLKPEFNLGEIRAKFHKYTEKVESILLMNLSYLGELSVIEARNNGRYKNITNNLRSSIGYLIVKDGSVVKKLGFNRHGLAEYNMQGAEKGESLALKLAAEQPKNSYSLIVVAGMNYAVYVESKGYNVLTSSEELVRRELPKMVTNLNKLIS